MQAKGAYSFPHIDKTKQQVAMFRGVATIEATEALASVKNALFYIAHTRFIIVHYLELWLSQHQGRKPGGRCGFQKLCTWYCRL
jgi:hypothetical protein